MINVVTHHVEYEYVHQTLGIMCMALCVWIYRIQCVVFWFVCVAHVIKVNFIHLGTFSALRCRRLSIGV